MQDKIYQIYRYLLNEGYKRGDMNRDIPLPVEISHMSTSMQLCRIEGIRRGLDPDISALIGLMHDVYRLFTGENEDHAIKSEPYVRDILKRFCELDEGKTEIIVRAIKNHSKKNEIGDEYEEMIKDVDVFDSFLYGMVKNDPHYIERLERMKKIYL